MDDLPAADLINRPVQAMPDRWHDTRKQLRGILHLSTSNVAPNPPYL